MEGSAIGGGTMSAASTSPACPPHATPHATPPTPHPKPPPTPTPPRHSAQPIHFWYQARRQSLAFDSIPYALVSVHHGRLVSVPQSASDAAPNAGIAPVCRLQKLDDTWPYPPARPQAMASAARDAPNIYEKLLEKRTRDAAENTCSKQNTCSRTRDAAENTCSKRGTRHAAALAHMAASNLC